MSSTFELVISLGLPNNTLGHGIIIAHVSPFFFLKNNIIIYKGKFSVYLFGGKIGWMENFGKKMRRKTFLSIFGWVGRKENK